MTATPGENVLSRGSIRPRAIQPTGTVNGTGVDCSGSDYAAMVWTSGAITDGTFTLTIEESDVVGGSYTAVPAGRLINALPVWTTTNQNSQAVTGFAVNTAKPFARGVCVVSGGATGGFISASVITTEIRLPVGYP